MTKYTACCLVLFCAATLANAQEKSAADYEADKARKLRERSPFEKIIAREAYATVVYEDAYVLGFAPIKNQAPVHYLIVPKKRIATVNDVTEEDAVMLGHLFLAAKEMAKKFGVAETGYRLTVNTNRDAGQSVFHLHVHLVGGAALGNISEASFNVNRKAVTPAASTLNSFAGSYRLPHNGPDSVDAAFVLRVTAEGQKLFTQIDGLPKTEVFTSSETRFFSKTTDSEIEFTKDSSGKTTALVLYQAGQAIRAPRIE